MPEIPQIQMGLIAAFVAGLVWIVRRTFRKTP